MGTTYAEYILSLYEIRKKKDIPFIREVVNYKGKLDEKYRGRLQLLLLCFYDIECLNGKIRVALKKLSPFILSLEKKIVAEIYSSQYYNKNYQFAYSIHSIVIITVI